MRTDQNYGSVIRNGELSYYPLTFDLGAFILDEKRMKKDRVERVKKHAYKKQLR